MSRRILVTGASGFIGLPLCALLSGAGIEVRAAVRRESAALAEIARRGPLHQLVVGDLAAAPDWSGALEGTDAVVHLAARVHLPGAGTRSDRERYRAVNVDATLQLAQAAARAGVKRMLFVSSVKAEGDATDPYSQSKAEAERELTRAAREMGLECVIVRPPLVYGPGVRANFLRLMRLVDSGVPLPLAGVVNRRSLVYVGNLADALRACIDHPAAPGQTFSVSDGEDVSTPELLRRIAHALGKPARLFSLPLALLQVLGRAAGQGESVERLTGSLTVDSAQIATALGWHPPYSMESGLAQTAAWYRARGGGAPAQRR